MAPAGEGLGSADDILTFLATELQCSRLLASRSLKGAKGTDRTVETQVAKIAGKLGVDLKGESSLPHAVASIENSVDRLLADLPKEYLGSQDRLMNGREGGGGSVQRAMPAACR